MKEVARFNGKAIRKTKAYAKVQRRRESAKKDVACSLLLCTLRGISCYFQKKIGYGLPRFSDKLKSEALRAAINPADLEYHEDTSYTVTLKNISILVCHPGIS